MNLRWLPEARADVQAITRYISQSNKEAALKWSGKIHAAARRAAEMPYSGRVVPELGKGDARENLVGNYRVLYRIRETEIHVFAVLDARRLMPQHLLPDEPE